MTTFDTVNLKFFSSLGFNQAKFDCVSRNRDGACIDERYELIAENKMPGITAIHVMPDSEETVVKFSAKVLRDDYLNGISANTVEQAVDYINSIGAVSIKSDDIEHAALLLCDYTKNINRPDVRQSIKSLLLAKSNTSFIVRNYDKVHNNGIEFRGRQTSYKNRQIYYNKRVELEQWRNKIFFKNLKNPVRLLERSNNILRVEHNLSTLRKIREEFKIDGTQYGPIKYPGFVDALQSVQNPILKRHEIITRYAQEQSIFDNYEGVALNELVNLLGWHRLYIECNGSMSLLEDFIAHKIENEENKNRSTTYRTIQKVRSLFAQYPEFKIHNNSDDTYRKELLEIGKQLKNAA